MPHDLPAAYIINLLRSLPRWPRTMLRNLPGAINAADFTLPANIAEKIYISRADNATQSSGAAIASQSSLTANNAVLSRLKANNAAYLPSANCRVIYLPRPRGRPLLPTSLSSSWPRPWQTRILGATRFYYKFCPPIPISLFLNIFSRLTLFLLSFE